MHGLWLTVLLFQQQAVDVPGFDSNPFTSPSDLAQGEKLYLGRCAGCHGPRGDGGKGANLAVPTLSRAADDKTLWNIIRYGVPDTEMPSSLMAQREIWQVAAFVKSLGAIQSGAASGDPKRGEAVTRGKGGCLQCHAIGSDGGRMGPALTDIGARSGPGHLRAKIVEPQGDVPHTFRLASLRGRDGKTVSGIRLNEDTFSIQIRDMTGGLRSYWKKDLADWKMEKRSPMPSYKGKLSDGEIDDLVAYLAGLRGAKGGER